MSIGTPWFYGSGGRGVTVIPITVERTLQDFVEVSGVVGNPASVIEIVFVNCGEAVLGDVYGWVVVLVVDPV